MRTSALLLLVACGTAPPPRSAAPPPALGPWAGCLGVHRDASSDDIACDQRLRLTVIESAGQERELGELLRAVVEHELAEPRQEIGPVTTHGADMAIDMHALAMEGWGRATRTKDGQRVILCVVDGPETTPAEREHCLALLAAAAQSPPPATVFREAGLAPPRGRFPGGGETPLPPGCIYRREAQDIFCPMARIHWMWQQQVPRPLASTVERAHDTMVALGVVEEGREQRPCHVAGTAGLCQRVRLSWPAQSLELRMVVALFPVEGDDLGLSCVWDASLGEAIPPPCSAVVSLD